MLMKQNLAKRVQRLGRLASIWDQVVPEELNRHTSIESFNRGVLTVMVDSAPHRFQLNTMLQAGLLRQIQSLFKTGAINKVRLIPGQFYSIDVSGTPRYTV
jgi:predicted nucleic acid-binding Zn ribbon protein